MGRCTKTILERNRILKRINGAEGRFFFDIVDWWLKCLEEMADMLIGAQWNVHLDDMDLKWSEKEHSFCVDDTVEN